MRVRGSAPACNIKSACKSDEVILTSDTGGGCTSGHKNLCCKKKTSNEALSQCVWKGSAPRCERDNKCPSDKPKEIARSPTGDNQQECDVYGFGDAQQKQLKVLCCTDPPPYTGWLVNHHALPFYTNNTNFEVCLAIGIPKVPKIHRPNQGQLTVQEIVQVGRY